MFQRTPSYAWPAGNKPLDADLQVKVKEQYRELRAEQRRNFGGVVGTAAHRGAAATRRRHPRGDAGGAARSGRRARVGGVPSSARERRAPRPRRQRDGRRALPRDGARGSSTTRSRRRPVAARLADRAASGSCTPTTTRRSTGSTCTSSTCARRDRGDHADGHPHRAGRSSSTPSSSPPGSTP